MLPNEVFTPSDIIGVRPTVAGSSFAIWLQLTSAAGERFIKLPAGLQLVCSSPRGTIGHTGVEDGMGIGSGGYFFHIDFATRSEFEDAIRKLH